MSDERIRLMLGVMAAERRQCVADSLAKLAGIPDAMIQEAGLGAAKQDLETALGIMDAGIEALMEQGK